MVVWIIGLSGAGKTELSLEIVGQVRSKGVNVVLLDGDVIRQLFGDDIGHTVKDRHTNAERISRLCKFLDDQGIHVVCAVLSIFHESQEWNRKNLSEYFEVFIDAPFETLLERDGKGLYRRALKEGLKNVVGVDIAFPRPLRPDMVVENSGSLADLLAHAPSVADLFISLGQ